MKRYCLLTVVAMLLALPFSAQAAPAAEKDSLKASRDIQVKLSALAAIGIVNPAVEFKVYDKLSVQLEALGIFYSENFLGTGKPLVLGAGFLELRYYPKALFRGFYFGPNIGYGSYRLNKGLVLRYTDDYDNDCYQVGSNIMAGLTIGYTFNLNSHWSLEVSWSGGFQHSRYTGFSRESKDEPYTQYYPLNSSAEWPPLYKGGLFVVYKF